MNITFSDSFFKSLKKIARQKTWWYKTYYFFSKGLPEFVKNVYRFRKELYDHRWWDYRFTLDMMQRSLIIMEEGLRTKGSEVRCSNPKKLEAIARVIEILENEKQDNYIERAEQELGELRGNLYYIDSNLDEKDRDHNNKVFNRATELQEGEWEELWKIIKGQGHFHDGTGMRSWWD